MLPKLTGADVVALVIIIGCFVAIMTGHNSVVEVILISIAGAYGVGKVGITIKKKK